MKTKGFFQFEIIIHRLGLCLSELHFTTVYVMGPRYCITPAVSFTDGPTFITPNPLTTSVAYIWVFSFY